ncbi:MAG: DUF2779 domain-containing protein, partial [Bacteroidia bacterium]|nr:DUF2779 domain-containing protein [Bacteroidia bacterium]
AKKQTALYLKEENITLFEPYIESDQKLIRIDILNKKENHYQLIEVKSKSYNSKEDPKAQKKGLKEYIYDLAYQYLVLHEYLAQKDKPFTITPYLYLPDKSKRSKTEGLNSLFKLREEEFSGKTFRAVAVDIDENYKKDIENEELLVLVDLYDEVIELQEEIKQKSTAFLKSLNPVLINEQAKLNKGCFSCEYNVANEEFKDSGFELCWKDKDTPKHGINDLYYSGSLSKKSQGIENLVDHLIEVNELSMYDIPEEFICDGTRGQRQRIQLEFTEREQEYFSDDMTEELQWTYPLHFIDFETATAALPYHKGMNPYEAVAFQWSCHTIREPGAEPEHFEWINLSQKFPNFDFARALMDCIGTEGTVLMWATHENTILRNVFNQMEKYNIEDDVLKDWLKGIVKFGKDDKTRLLDMNRFTLEHYFHPKMKGKTSIKKVLPAVLYENSSTRISQWLKEFDSKFSLLNEEDGRITDPYAQLPPLDIFDQAEKYLKDGGGAMAAYQDILFGLRKNDAESLKAYEKGLLNYCKLDTLAMVIIWEHWKISLST